MRPIVLQSLTTREARLHAPSDKQSLKPRFYTPSFVKNRIYFDHPFKRITKLSCSLRLIIIIIIITNNININIIINIIYKAV